MKITNKKFTAAEMLDGSLLEAGTASQFITGGWKSERPVWNKEKCINCMICWINCPDACIEVKDGKLAGIDLTHCKGCGICAKECPPKIKAITMEAEKK